MKYGGGNIMVWAFDGFVCPHWGENKSENKSQVYQINLQDNVTR